MVLPGAASPAANQLTVSVAPYPAAGVVANLPYVTVTICNGPTCVNVDHVIVDTGSFGLRVLQSAVSTLNLSPSSTGTGSVAECAQFLDGTMWGSVAQGSLTLGGEPAVSVPIQLIGDPAVGGSPGDCTVLGRDESTLSKIGGNGLLGVGQFVTDGGPYFNCTSSTTCYGPYYYCSTCGTPPAGKLYFSCTSGTYASCPTPNNPIAVAPVVNPVPSLQGDHNGVILQLPAIGSTGAATATGLLTFGVGTRANNSISSYSLLSVPSSGSYAGDFNATVQGTSYPWSFLDSGSNYNFLNLSGVPVDSYGSYAPPAWTSFATTLSPNVGSGASISTSLDVIAGSQLQFGTNTAFNDIATTGAAGSQDLGLPYFYGRGIALVISGQSAGSNSGPFYAIQGN